MVKSVYNVWLEANAFNPERLLFTGEAHNFNDAARMAGEIIDPSLRGLSGIKVVVVNFSEHPIKKTFELTVFKGVLAKELSSGAVIPEEPAKTKRRKKR